MGSFFVATDTQLLSNWLFCSSVTQRMQAFGFITGDQAAIPDWAERLYVGCCRGSLRDQAFLSRGNPALWNCRG
jgi:hypothetical protein